MKKKTDDIAAEIKNTGDIETYMRENSGEFSSVMFQRTLKQLCGKSGLSQETIAERSMLSHGFVNNLLNNAKKSRRDTVIKLAFGLGLNVDDTNRLLKLAGHGELYPRIERDAIILFCLNKGVSLIDTNILLQKRLQVLLTSVS
ncbi:MAG: helix-turn-helix domain-containing protein [Clostridiales bacterium]|jgi:transcriptional regulator with XRE-family HTH domain|nr:helix-turn-helix domain-containing protein [Clostridiales bacterium]